MQLAITELDDTPIETTYWDQPPPLPTARKTVSFDDILSNMNLVVNAKGVLQYMVPGHVAARQATATQEANAHPLRGPIIDKYFKNYYTQPAAAPKIPTTRAEYNRMQYDAAVQRHHIQQAKSTQMRFTQQQQQQQSAPHATTGTPQRPRRPMQFM